MPNRAQKIKAEECSTKCAHDYGVHGHKSRHDCEVDAEEIIFRPLVIFLFHLSIKNHEYD